MNALDDMTEKKLHDATEDHGFSGVEASPAGPFNEFPFRGPDMEMDYRQPGFSFASPKPNYFVPEWPSFVQGVECIIPASFEAPDGHVFGVSIEVRWEFKSIPLQVPPGSEPLTRKFASGAYLLASPTFISAATLPASHPIAYDGNYLDTGKTIFGADFEDTETLVCQLGVVTNGKLVRTIEAGNLFLSRYPRYQSTELVTNP